MNIAHIGPPLARTGGPAGYMFQVRDALASRPTRHVITFPDPAATPAAAAAAGPSLFARALTRARRALTGAPKFYRPSPASLATRGGELDAMLRKALASIVAVAEPSLDRAIGERADVLFTHDPVVAAAAIERRTSGQAVWLMLHTPMSMALYLAWNWGVPEHDWRQVLAYPDVREWTRREVDICARVDRLILPCREAAAELERCDTGFAPLLARAELLMSGASRRTTASADSRNALRARWGLPIDQPVGLFLGSAQSYRGFDALVSGLSRLEDPVALPGMIAVAGPDPRSLPVHERLRPLGRVEDVSALLRAVDFVVNVNRFSLFDLSIIEALEQGRPLLMHDTGGNRTFRALGAGCVVIPDLEPPTVAAGLEQLFSLPSRELEAMGQRSRACYDANLTPAHLAARHLALYDRADRRVAAMATA